MLDLADKMTGGDNHDYKGPFTCTFVALSVAVV